MNTRDEKSEDSLKWGLQTNIYAYFERMKIVMVYTQFTLLTFTS
jgi:hypothetical protein